MPRHNKAQYWIERLNLEPHPEGGHFKEIYRSEELIPEAGLPDRFENKRSFSTSIFFLLQKNEFSAFHRLKSGETWYFHDGDPLELFIIDKKGSLQKIVIGIDEKAFPQFTIPHNHWFAAKTKGDFTLLGCNVAPGFDFADFELATFEDLSKAYPQHEKIISDFTY